MDADGLMEDDGLIDGDSELDGLTDDISPKMVATPSSPLPTVPRYHTSGNSDGDAECDGLIYADGLYDADGLMDAAMAYPAHAVSVCNRG